MHDLLKTSSFELFTDQRHRIMSTNFCNSFDQDELIYKTVGLLRNLWEWRSALMMQGRYKITFLSYHVRIKKLFSSLLLILKNVPIYFGRWSEDGRYMSRVLTVWLKRRKRKKKERKKKEEKEDEFHYCENWKRRSHMILQRIHVEEKG